MCCGWQRWAIATALRGLMPGKQACLDAEVGIVGQG
jgi:hypothetical protein